MSSLRFHLLKVSDVSAQTDDSVAVTLEVPPNLGTDFGFSPGQHVTVRKILDGEDIRRSYSICTDSNSGVLRVGIRRIEGGRFSAFATNRLEVGEELEVMPPVGEFTHEPDRPGRFVAIVAGSGITPVLSMISSNLEACPGSSWTLLYGNRTSRSIMFLEELENLKDRHLDRFRMVHVLSREPNVIPLFEGRLDRVKIESILSSLIDVRSVDAWYLCGPLGMVEDGRAVLSGSGVEPEAVHFELFFDERVEKVPTGGESREGLAEVTLTLDGRSSVVYVDPGGPSILEYARTVRSEVPFACKGGMCATCKAVVTVGEVRMDKNYALTAEEQAAGFILTCQSHPVTSEVAVSYDTHGGVGR